MVMNIVKSLLPRSLHRHVFRLRAIWSGTTPFAERECAVCGYKGHFYVAGRPPRLDAHCPSCSSLERHRLLMLMINNCGFRQFDDPEAVVLHFAAEPVLERLLRHRFDSYKTADLFSEADLRLNIEMLDMPDNSLDIVIANHVLEHVDDESASDELFRCLKVGGILVCQVPIIEGWENTYENHQVNTDVQRELHFGQSDHVRYYGKDFRRRISKSGLVLVNEYTAEGPNVARYGLLRGEKVFVFQK